MPAKPAPASSFAKEERRRIPLLRKGEGRERSRKFKFYKCKTARTFSTTSDGLKCALIK